jgi:hypothetical protein
MYISNKGERSHNLIYELTGNISTAPLRGFFDRTVPVTFGVVVDAFTDGTATGEVILFFY